MSAPRVSVIVPCHNGGRFLDRLLASLAAQTFRDFETIVVDNGSTEGDTLRKLDQLDPMVQVVHQENRYLPGARNRGFLEARAAFVLPLDCDDTLEPSYLAETVPLLERAPADVGFVFTHLRLTDSLAGVLPRHLNRFDQLVLNQLPYCMLFRRSAWQAVGGYDETMHDGSEDWEFTIRLSKAGFRGIELAKPLFVYAVRPDGMLLSRATRMHGTIWGHIRSRHAELYRIGALMRSWRETRGQPSKVSAGTAIALLLAAKLLPEAWFNALFFWLLVKTRSRRIDRGELKAGGADGVTSRRKRAKPGDIRGRAMPKILYFAPEDWAFVSHFRPMAQAARECGLDVVVATRVHRHADVITGDGYALVALQSRRGRLDPLGLLQSLLEMVRIIRREQPTIVHCVSLPLAIVGGLAAQLTRQRHIVLAVTGLGFAWIERGVVAASVRALARAIVAFLLRHDGTVCVFENAEDPREFRLAPSDPKVTLVGGAGVDPRAFQCGAEPAAPPVKVVVLARMIRPKGIAESVAAIQRARALGAPVELDLYGAPDAGNRTSYTEADVQQWAHEPGIRWHGATQDVARVLCEHHIAMLLSAREGVPRCLVEAAAAGRPIVASDVAGCREVVRDRQEGYLVPFGDVEATARALVELAADPALRQRLGAAANARFHTRFTAASVRAVFAGLYRSLIPDLDDAESLAGGVAADLDS